MNKVKEVHRFSLAAMVVLPELLHAMGACRRATRIIRRGNHYPTPDFRAA